MSEREKCPDKGTCHHECADGPCFRVLYCAPLYIAKYPGDYWPPEVVEEHQAKMLTEGNRSVL